MDAWGGAWGDCWGGAWGAVDVAAAPAPFTGADDAAELDRQRDRIRRQNDLILKTVLAAVLGGMIE